MLGFDSTRGNAMTKAIKVFAAAGAVAIAAAALPRAAEAGGGDVAAGIIGGLAAGAVIGSTVAGPGYYGAGPYYYYGPARYRCHWRREKVWDGYGWMIRRVRVCY
jgi:hypothetical protein